MKHSTDSLLDLDTNTETTTQTTTQTPVTLNTHNTEQTNRKQTSDIALQIHHRTNKCNNPLYIKILANQLKIQTPKTYWSEKNKTTTLIFTTRTELNTFKQQIQANTFGNQVQYYLPTPKNSVTHTQVIREANVVAMGVNADIDVSDIESELTDDGIDFTSH